MKNIKNLILLSVIALILNLFWEFSHYYLYVDLSGIPRYPHLILASFTDMIIILAIFIAISIFNKEFEWINKPNNKDYFLIIIFGLFIAVVIEAVNLNLERWDYTDAMPLIFGVGLSPLIQLAVTGIIALMILKIFK